MAVIASGTLLPVSDSPALFLMAVMASGVFLPLAIPLISHEIH
jgi:hypothetical protein